MRRAHRGGGGLGPHRVDGEGRDPGPFPARPAPQAAGAHEMLAGAARSDHSWGETGWGAPDIPQPNKPLPQGA